jgi:hypothetical protein
MLAMDPAAWRFRRESRALTASLMAAGNARTAGALGVLIPRVSRLPRPSEQKGDIILFPPSIGSFLRIM